MAKDNFSEKLIDKAAEVFNHFGYGKTTINEIARQLGKGKSSIYYYYSSKEEIFQAVVEKEAAELKSQIKVAISKATTAKDKFRNYVITRIKISKKVNNLYNALQNDGLAHLDFIETMKNRYERMEIDLVKSILTEGVEKKEFNVEEIHLAAVAMVVALKGIVEEFYQNNKTKSLEAKLDNLLNILFYGIIRR